MSGRLSGHSRLSGKSRGEAGVGAGGQPISAECSVGAIWQLARVSHNVGWTASCILCGGREGRRASCALCGSRPMGGVQPPVHLAGQACLSWSAGSLRPVITGLPDAPLSPLFGKTRPVQGDREETRKNKAKNQSKIVYLQYLL